MANQPSEMACPRSGLKIESIETVGDVSLKLTRLPVGPRIRADLRPLVSCKPPLELGGGLPPQEVRRRSVVLGDGPSEDRPGGPRTRFPLRLRPINGGEAERNNQSGRSKHGKVLTHKNSPVISNSRTNLNEFISIIVDLPSLQTEQNFTFICCHISTTVLNSTSRGRGRDFSESRRRPPPTPARDCPATSGRRRKGFSRRAWGRAWAPVWFWRRRRACGRDGLRACRWPCRGVLPRKYPCRDRS